MARESLKAYTTLKNMPDFLEYLNFASPLKYYSETNIASRPSKRKQGKLNLDDLRAVPYVGAWSQLKQNLPGYYGVGIAFQKIEEQGKWDDVNPEKQGTKVAAHYRFMVGPGRWSVGRWRQSSLYC